MWNELWEREESETFLLCADFGDWGRKHATSRHVSQKQFLVSCLVSISTQRNFLLIYVHF